MMMIDSHPQPMMAFMTRLCSKKSSMRYHMGASRLFWRLASLRQIEARGDGAGQASLKHVE